MLVPFVIDVESLTPDPKNRTPNSSCDPALRACHKNLIDVWQRIGLLVHDGDHFENSHLYTAINNLPQSLRSYWQKTLEKRVPSIACGTGWNGTVETNTLKNFCAIAQLAIVDDTRAYVEFGFSDEYDEKSVSINHPKSNIDICRLIAANQATQFKNALSQSEAHIKCGDSYKEIWDSRFKMLAFAPIKHISIVDRYAVGQHMSNKRPQTNLSGLARFLRLLDKDSTGDRYITLYSAWTHQLTGKNPDDVTADIQDIIEHLPTKNIKCIKLYMIPNSGFKPGAHDRFIRFGSNFAWEIGRGIEVFEGPCAANKSTATFKTEILALKGFIDTEDELKKHPKVQFKEIQI